MSTQKISKEEAVSAKRKQPNRNRIPLHITLSKDIIIKLKEETDNISRFIEKAVEAT